MSNRNTIILLKIEKNKKLHHFYGGITEELYHNEYIIFIDLKQVCIS